MPAHSSPPRFEGLTVAIVGGTRGLGLQYASDLAQLGANVIITGRSSEVASVAAQISAAAGQVVGVQCDVRQPAPFIDTALAKFGQIDSLIVNAGIVRDRSFAKMSSEEWSDVIDIHLGGSFACAQAVWPLMVGRRSGSILLTTSGAGLHGAFGQANYAAAKAGVIGLGKTLAIEGKRSNIKVNMLAPMASTEMTGDVFNERLHNSLNVYDVSPFALALVHPDCPLTGQVIECGGGWAAALRWQRALGVRHSSPFHAENVFNRLSEMTNFSDGFDLPSSILDSLGAALDDPRAIKSQN